MGKLTEVFLMCVELIRMLTGQKKWEETSSLETNPGWLKPSCSVYKLCYPWHGAYLKSLQRTLGRPTFREL